MNTSLPTQLPDGMSQRLRTLAEEMDAAGIPFLAVALTQRTAEDEKTVHVSASNETIRKRMSNAESFEEDLEIAVAYAAAKQESPEKLVLALAVLVDVPMEQLLEAGITASARTH